jgi:hypothetical protein
MAKAQWFEAVSEEIQIEARRRAAVTTEEHVRALIAALSNIGFNVYEPSAARPIAEMATKVYLLAVEQHTAILVSQS